MNTQTPETDEIIRELESKLQESSEAMCNCGSIEIEHGCPSCSKYTSAIKEATQSISKLERERNEARDERDSARDAYQIVKDSLHDNSTRLETLLAACDDHADGSVDATPLGKFCNEMVGLSNGIMLHEVLTLRAEVYKLREACDDLAWCLENPAVFKRLESIEALSNYNGLPHVKARLSK